MHWSEGEHTLAQALDLGEGRAFSTAESLESSSSLSSRSTTRTMITYRERIGNIRQVHLTLRRPPWRNMEHKDYMEQYINSTLAHRATEIFDLSMMWESFRVQLRPLINEQNLSRIIHAFRSGPLKYLFCRITTQYPRIQLTNIHVHVFLHTMLKGSLPFLQLLLFSEEVLVHRKQNIGNTA